MPVSKKFTLQRMISALEIAFHLKLSPEQLDIIKAGHKFPRLVNACAGSGKTTTSLFDIVLAVQTEEVAPNHILGITFSKSAQLNMLNKYNDALHNLKKHGYKVNEASKPKFSTFDALFYHLLRHFKEFRKARVLPSYTRIMIPLEDALVKKPKNFSEQGELKHIFAFRSMIINNRDTYNGVNLHRYSDDVIGLGQLAQRYGISRPVDFWKNYLAVGRAYLKYKIKYNLVDFLDMKVLLMKKVGSQAGREVVQKLMSKYHLCYIDEFQDIDSLQWALIRRILSKHALQTITVIGDDDQSIYSWRGSNPRIILNFTKNYPKTHKYNLSTNYRTNRMVLNSVKPLIMRNKYRMDKTLKAAKSIVPGGTYELVPSKHEPASDLLLSKVWNMYKSPKIKDKDIIILVRYNLDKMLATDWFANRGLYIKGNHILQKDSIYKVFYNLISGLYFNNLYTIKKCFGVLGFRPYKQHMANVAKMYFPHTNALNAFLKSVRQYDERARLLDSKGNINQTIALQARKSRKMRYLQQIIETDLALMKAWKIREATPSESGSVAYGQAATLSRNYFSFMIEKNYMSQTEVKVVSGYLSQELSQFKDVGTFLTRESQKGATFGGLANSNIKNKINILTIHQSKGLQFKYVFLFNLTNHDVTPEKQALSHIFSPNVTKPNFVHILLNLSAKQLNKIENDDSDDDNAPTPYRDFCKTIDSYHDDLLRYYKHSAKPGQNPLAMTDRDTGNVLEHLINNEYDYDKPKNAHQKMQKSLQTNFNTIYLSTRETVAKVEEERRLIYVGFTRAEHSAVFNFGANGNPLLTEMKINPSHILTANKYGQAVLFNSKAAKQARALHKKIADLKAKANKLF